MPPTRRGHGIGAKQAPADEGQVTEIRIPAVHRDDRQRREQRRKQRRVAAGTIGERRALARVRCAVLPVRAARTIRARPSSRPPSAATAAGSNGCSTMAKLVFAGSAKGRAIAPSSSSFTTRAIGTSGGYSPPVPEVMMMSPRLNGLRPTSSGRTSIVPSPRPLCNHGDAAPQQSRRDDVGPVGHEEHARGDGPRIDDPADEAVRRAHRHPDANAVACSCREDRRSAGGC